MIPRQFELMALTVTVEVTDELPKDLDGHWSHSKQRIRVRPVGKKVTEQAQLQAFWHEAVHAILQVLSYDKLSDDEKFVDRLAQCLAQIEQTRR